MPTAHIRPGENGMKYPGLLLLSLLFPLAAVAENAPLIPKQQHLAALDYSTAGKQSGCGLRVTGEAAGDLWINILLSVFIKENAPPVGMFKLVVRKMNMQNGEPVVRDGKIVYEELGRIQRAWLRTGSGVELQPYANGMAQHGDGYMTSLAFSNAMDLLASIPQGKFRTGFSREENGPEQVIEFDRRFAPEEANRLNACMKNLQDATGNRPGESL